MKTGGRITGVAIVLATAAGCAPAAQHASPNAPESEARSTALLSAAISAPASADDAAAGSTGARGAPETIPNACVGEQSIKNAKACLPPGMFAKKLCGGIYPEVALAMFAKGTPWTRIWLAGDVEAWNASGGLTHRARLAFDEEVIVLSRHSAGGGGGIVMTGAMASYDVLRWDGTCVSVMEGELTARRPPAPKPAPVPWSRLEETTRRALLVSPKVKATHDSLDKACGSAMSAAEKKSCERADRAFASAVAEFVRGGGALPTPARRP
jgi:hypothetical protein